MKYSESCSHVTDDVM